MVHIFQEIWWFNLISIKKQSKRNNLKIPTVLYNAEEPKASVWQEINIPLSLGRLFDNPKCLFFKWTSHIYSLFLLTSYYHGNGWGVTLNVGTYYYACPPCLNDNNSCLNPLRFLNWMLFNNDANFDQSIKWILV